MSSTTSNASQRQLDFPRSERDTTANALGWP